MLVSKSATLHTSLSAITPAVTAAIAAVKMNIGLASMAIFQPVCAAVAPVVAAASPVSAAAAAAEAAAFRAFNAIPNSSRAFLAFLATFHALYASTTTPISAPIAIIDFTSTGLFCVNSLTEVRIFAPACARFRSSSLYKPPIVSFKPSAAESSRVTSPLRLSSCILDILSAAPVQLLILSRRDS